MVAGSMSTCTTSFQSDDTVVEIRSKDPAKKGRLKMFVKRGLTKTEHRRSSSLPPENRVKLFFRGTMTLRGIFRNHSSAHSPTEKRPTRVYSRKGRKVSISSPILGKLQADSVPECFTLWLPCRFHKQRQLVAR